MLWTAAGHDVLLVDADDQATASDFAALRNERLADGTGFSTIRLSGMAVRNEVRRMAGKYDDVVIDTGGRDTASQRAALAGSDMLLTPFVPRSFDVWTLQTVAGLVSELRTVNPGLMAFAFLNRADSRGADNDAAEEMIRETADLCLLPTRLGARKAFGNAAAEGIAVTELRRPDPKATAEVLALAECVERKGKR